MTTKSKAVIATTNQWVLKNKETGKVYSNWTYPSRNAARKAAKGRRFKGMYAPVKSGDGGIDPKKLKKGKPAPKPKSELNLPTALAAVYEAEFAAIYNLIDDVMDIVLEVVPEGDISEFYTEPVETQHTFSWDTPVTKESTTMSTRKAVNTKPKLRSSSSAPGSKFHRHGTFGTK